METVQKRIEDAMREIAVLLVAFAPLDVALGSGSPRTGTLLLFLIIGVFLFLWAIWLERRRANDT